MKRIDKAYILRHIIRFANKRQKEEERQFIYDDCVQAFKKRLEYNNIPVDIKSAGEEEYIKFWNQFCDRVEPYTYRFFSRIVGPNPHIVPENIAGEYIESILNPEKFRDFYSDKNMYSRYIQPSIAIPHQYIHRIEGGLMVHENKYYSFDISAKEVAELIGWNVDKVVLKPSNYSHSGSHVMLFRRKNDVFCNDNDELSGRFLNYYEKDFVIQEVIEQHPFLSQFCKSSCNTMRIMTYRSVIDESVTVFGAVLRIGHEGSFVDNLFAGGGFVVINIDTGELGKVIYDEYGRPADSINGISFATNNYIIPFWEQATHFAKSIAQQIPHHRLLAQDIIIDCRGQSRLIEFNVDGFNWSFTMYGGKIPFGEKFNEVIDYCMKYKIEIDK